MHRPVAYLTPMCTHLVSPKGVRLRLGMDLILWPGGSSSRGRGCLFLVTDDKNHKRQ